jgi:hypothetical protein
MFGETDAQHSLMTLDLSISIALRFMMSLVSLTFDWMIILCSFSSCESISVFYTTLRTRHEHKRANVYNGMHVIRAVLPLTCFTCITVTFSL